MNFMRWLLIVGSLFLTACAGTQQIKFQPTEVISKDVYTQSLKNNGVVLMDINWGRWWGCVEYENAQLISLAFDRLPVQVVDDESEPALVLHSPSRVMVDLRWTPKTGQCAKLVPIQKWMNFIFSAKKKISMPRREVNFGSEQILLGL